MIPAIDHWERNKDRLAFDNRGDFVVIYRHRKYHDLSFIEYYKWYGEMGGARKYWNNQDYVSQISFDLNAIRQDLDPTYRVKKRRVARGA